MMTRSEQISIKQYDMPIKLWENSKDKRHLFWYLLIGCSSNWVPSHFQKSQLAWENWIMMPFLGAKKPSKSRALKKYKDKVHALRKSVFLSICTSKLSNLYTNQWKRTLRMREKVKWELSGNIPRTQEHMCWVSELINTYHLFSLNKLTVNPNKNYQQLQ